MTPPKKTPAPQRRQAEGDTGVEIAGPSVPAWARKRVAAALVRFQGQYLSPAAIHAQAASEAAAARTVGAAHGDALHLGNEHAGGLAGTPTPESPAASPADRFSWEPSVLHFDWETGEVLPCRSLETTASKGGPNTLTGPHKKVAAALSWNVAHLVQQYGIDRVGFLTLTFADHVVDAREASRRYHSLHANILSKRYAAAIRVLERQKSGRIHYHLLVVLPDDIRTGADFDQFASKDYRSANNHLRREWAFWRHTAPQFRFGRTELMPIRSNADALGQYVGKYIGKHIAFREERDKGVRLVSYSKGARMATSKFTAITNHPESWRAKVLTFSRQVEAWKRIKNPNTRINSMDDLAHHLGKRWAYHWRDYITQLPPADLSVPF